MRHELKNRHMCDERLTVDIISHVIPNVHRGGPEFLAEWSDRVVLKRLGAHLVKDFIMPDRNVQSHLDNSNNWRNHNSCQRLESVIVEQRWGGGKKIATGMEHHAINLYGCTVKRDLATVAGCYHWKIVSVQQNDGELDHSAFMTRRLERRTNS